MRGRSLLVFACTLVAASAHADDTRSIELFSTNDIHGHLEMAAFKTHHSHDGPSPTIGGGLVLLSGFIKNARAHYGKRMVLVDGGDLFQGTLASNMSEGAAMVRGLDQLGYIAGALGNHEFDYGPVGPKPKPTSPKDDPRGALFARMHELNFPLLSANVKKTDGSQLVPGYVLREIDGVPLGIVGGTTESLFSTTMAENLTGLKMDKLAPSVIAAGRDAVAHGAKVLIAVVHAGAECSRAPHALDDQHFDSVDDCKGNEEAMQLAHALADSAREGGPRFSAIVAGHTHAPIALVVDGIPVVESGHAAQYLSHVSIEVVGRGANAKPTGHFSIERTIEVCTRLDDSGHCAASNVTKTHPQTWLGPIKPDPVVEAAVQTDVMEAHKLADRPLGVTLPEGLSQTYSAENPLGNFVADTIRSATKSDFGVMNGGGLRASLPRGPLTFGSLYETFPFENEAVVVNLTGKQVLALAEHNLASLYATLSWSGVTLDARCEGNKLHLVMTLPDGKPIDPNAHYRVGTVDFLAHGGDDMVGGSAIIESGYGTVREAMEHAFTKHAGEVRPAEFFDATHRRLVLEHPRPLRCSE